MILLRYSQASGILYFYFYTIIFFHSKNSTLTVPKQFTQLKKKDYIYNFFNLHYIVLYFKPCFPSIT